VEQQIAAAQERAREAERFRVEMEQVRGEAATSRGEVRVVVDAQGRLLDLRMRPEATGYAAADVAQAVLRLVGEAHQKAAQQAVRLAEERFGEGSALVEQVAAAFVPGRSGA